MRTIVKANGIDFSYNKQNNVLTHIDFEILENDYIGLIGPNGGGKSTLLKIILGLLEPDKGEVIVLDQSSKNARDEIGYVPQYTKIDLDFPLSAWEVVMGGFLGKKRIGSFYSKEEKSRAEKVLKELKLTNLKNKTIGELSGGQRQRIMIARALVRSPKLLLLDEPTNNVDEKSGQDLYELLHTLNDKMAIILVSHDIDMVSQHVKKVFCLNNKIVCNDAEEITKGETQESMKKVLHSKECIIH